MENCLGPESPNVTKSLLNLAGLLYMRGSYSDALPIFRSNLTILEQKVDINEINPVELVEPLNNIANCLCKLGNYADAKPYYKRGIKFCRNYVGSKHPDFALTQNNLASYYLYTANHKKAGLHYRRSLTILVKTLGLNTPAVANVLINQANLHTINGEHSKAKGVLNRSLLIHVKCLGAESFEAAKSMRSLASCLCRLDKIDEAETLYRQCITIMKKRVGPDNSDVAISQRCLANLLLSRGKHSEAKTLYYRSIATFDQQFGPEHPEIAKSLIGLAKYYEAFNIKSVAIFYAKFAINILQNVRKNVSNISKNTLSNLDSSLVADYTFLANLLIESNRYGEAEYVMGMLKDRQRRELLRRDIPEGHSVKAIAWNPVEAVCDEKLEIIFSKLYGIGTQIAILKQIKNKTLAQNKELSELEIELYEGYRELSEFIDNFSDFFSASHDKIEIDNEAYKIIDLTCVAPKTVAIFTVTAENVFHTVLITPNGHIPFSSNYSTHELSKKIIELRILLSDEDEAYNNSDSFLPLAKELYDIILRPLEKDLNDGGVETIIWMLDGALRLLPLSALHDGEHFFLEKYCNANITPVSNNVTKTHEPWSGLGMGTTRGFYGLEPLPAVKDELEGIICNNDSDGILPGEVLLDEDFTRETMQKNLLEGYSVAHIASHFELNPVNETMSYLLLGDGSKLRMDELREFPNLFKGVDLVTFSACKTGLGSTDTKGQIVDGLGYLGELQGANAVLASLWSPNDKSTSMLMPEFYRIREKGYSKAKALQQAQVAMLTGKLYSEEGHDFSHPFFWAPFILIGNES